MSTQLHPERRHALGDRAVLIFSLSQRLVAVPAEAVERIALMAELARPPGLPAVLEGLLNVSGVAIPVLRLDRLLQLPSQQIGLYSALLIVRDAGIRWSILVDEVRGLATVPVGALLPLAREDSFNGTAEAALRWSDQIVPLLTPARVLRAKEDHALREFAQLAQERLRSWSVPA